MVRGFGAGGRTLMLIIPAIDIKGGRCVRLLQGDPQRQITYGEDPVAVARKWAGAGAAWLHVVDLDGAFTGRPGNLDLLRRIVKVGVPVQTGGGFRTMADVQAGVAAGAARVVLGTSAAALAGAAVERYGERIVVAVDVRDGVPVTHGWTQPAEWDAVLFARSLVRSGVRRFIYTDVGRDGMLAGPGADRIREFVRAVECPVIAAGGVASTEDLRALEVTGVEGVIVGRALYEGRLALAELRAGRP